MNTRCLTLPRKATTSSSYDPPPVMFSVDLRVQIRYNKYLLAVLTFITKCVGLDVVDLEEVVEQHGVSIVVYGTPVVPSKVTLDIVDALEQEGTGHKPSGGGAPARARSARQHAKHGGGGGGGVAGSAAVQAEAGAASSEAAGSKGVEDPQGEALPDLLTPTDAVESMSAALTKGYGVVSG